MKKLSEAVKDYLSGPGQPQTYGAIAQHLEDAGYVNFDRSDIEALADAGEISRAGGGVDNRGEPVTLYAPL